METPERESKHKEITPWAIQAVILGVVGILMGRLPSWVAGLPLRLEFSWDRFMLSMMLGASFFFVGLVNFLLKDDHRKTVVISLFIALAVGKQFTTANTFRRDWANQQQFFWQLAWRIPALEPNTMLVTHELPLVYETDFSLSAPLNWIYSPQINSRDLPYMLVYTKARLGSSILPSLQPDQETKINYRTMLFRGSTSDMVVFYHPVPGCVRILDPVYTSAETVPGLTYMVSDAIPLSNLSRITPNGELPVLPENLFGREPAHTWCYYYQKADLARQQGDWQKVAEFGNEAASNAYTAIMPAEWLPFLEAYARTGNFEEAHKLNEQIINEEPDLIPALCNIWQRIMQDPSTSVESSDQGKSVLTRLQCEN